MKDKASIYNKVYYGMTLIALLAACSGKDSYDYGLAPQTDGKVAISFGSNMTDDEPMTRAAGLETAVQHFDVYGCKQTDETCQEVFPGYRVSWMPSAGTSSVNTCGWDYITTTQQPKYWDLSASHYCFMGIASSTGSVPLTQTHDAQGRISAAKISLTQAANGTDATAFYFSHIKRVEKADYREPVLLCFRPYLAQIRIGFYETLDEYSISDMTFDATSTDVIAHAQFVTEGTCTLTYNYTDNNVTTSMTPTATASAHTFGALQYGTDGKLGTSSATASFALGGGVAKEYFLPVLPYENNGQPLEIICSYTITPETGPATVVKNVKAIVPAEYAQWQPGGAYSYVFKIDKVKETQLDLDLEAMTKWQAGYVDKTKW